MSTKHIPPWDDGDKADSGASAESDEVHSHDELFDKREAGVSRRRFMVTAAGVAGAAGLSRRRGLLIPGLADNDDEHHKKDDRDGDADDASAPLPIPGGTVLPFSTERYHFFFPPGNAAPPIPATPGAAEPSLITDFRGFIGLAHVKGAGTGTNTETGATSRFFFDTDTRFMKGKYIGMCDHEEHRGAFAFI